jgi:hypothetical protein
MSSEHERTPFQFDPVPAWPLTPCVDMGCPVVRERQATAGFSDIDTKHDALAFLVAAVEQYVEAGDTEKSSALVKLLNVKDRVKKALASGVDSTRGGER